MWIALFGFESLRKRRQVEPPTHGFIYVLRLRHTVTQDQKLEFRCKGKEVSAHETGAVSAVKIVFCGLFLVN